jgi:hypothetical protein
VNNHVDNPVDGEARTPDRESAPPGLTVRPHRTSQKKKTNREEEAADFLATQNVLALPHRETLTPTALGLPANLAARAAARGAR